MAEAKKTTKVKTKTVPAKKPATKPKGASVKPKAIKTVSATTRKTTKSASKSSISRTSIKKTTAKKTRNASKTIFILLMIILGLAIVTGAIICVVNQCTDTVMIENANGDKLKAKRVSLEDYKYNIAIPVTFKKTQ